MAESKPLAPGILNFWNKPEEIKEDPEPKEVSSVQFRGQIFNLVIATTSSNKAKGAIGALIKAIIYDKNKIKCFNKQDLHFSPPLSLHTQITLGEIKLYAVDSSSNKEKNSKMIIDRIAYALSECRRDPEVNKMIEMINLRIITGDKS